MKIALGCLAVYTALSFASILWAAVPSDAWEGANRTLLYLLVFALFALWPQRGASAVLLLGGWTLAMIGLAAFVVLQVNAASARSLPTPDSRRTPGRSNRLCQRRRGEWLMAFWPALLLARSERLPWALRGVLAGGAVLLAEVALLSQSRGSLYATPVMLALVFALLPGRVRTFAVLVPVAVGIGVAAPAVLRVGDHLKTGRVAAGGDAQRDRGDVRGGGGGGAARGDGRGDRAPAILLAEHREASPPERCGSGGPRLLVAVLVGGVVAGGNPVQRIEHGWHTFKGGYSRR